MFVYEKRLEYPVKIKNTNPRLASLIISQYGGPYCVRRRCLLLLRGGIGQACGAIPCHGGVGTWNGSGQRRIFTLAAGWSARRH